MSRLRQRHSRNAVALLVLLAGFACASRVHVDAGASPDIANYGAATQLAYVTNRALETDTDGNQYYGGDRGDLTSGYCTVGFGPGARRGELLSIESAPGSGLPVGIAAGSGPLVVYVHGYSESFDKSCRRAAQLQENLRLQGRFVLFSWPSGNYLTYAQDQDMIAESVEQLNEFLEGIDASTPRDRVVVMAHSLGSRGVVDALALQPLRENGERRYRELVLLAPDIGRDEFVEDLHVLQGRVSAITVYMSDDDRALWLSAAVNVSGRLGLAEEFDADAEHLNVIDVTNTGADGASGHLYHLFNPAVIEDMRGILDSLDGTALQYRRLALTEPGFWRLEPAANDDTSAGTAVGN